MPPPAASNPPAFASSVRLAEAPAGISTSSSTRPVPVAYYGKSSRISTRFRGADLARIGIIGGSGLYSMPGFHAAEEVSITTPFGSPSDNYITGELEGREVAFLSRHGRGHRLSPSELNYRANIYGLKTLGVDRVLSLSAVGSLK